MKNYILFIFLFIFLLNNNLIAQEKIVFSINQKSYTTIDIENKINYLLFVNQFKQTEENIKNISFQVKDIIIEEELLKEYIEKRNIKIAEEDIEQTFLNLLKNMNFNNSENLIKNLHSYNIDKNYLYSQLENEIIKEVVKQILLKQINKIILPEIINYNDYIEYKISNLTLYKENLSKDDFIQQKDEINKILRNNKFNNSIEIILNKNLNISQYQNKWINLNSLNKDLKKIIIKAKFNQAFIYEDSKAIYFFEKKDKNSPNIDLFYSFIQLSSKKNGVIEKYISNNELCEKNNIKQLDANKKIKFKFYENINVNTLNKEVFEKINYVNDYMVINSKDAKTLIHLCNINYNNDELKEYITNKYFLDKLDIKFNKLLLELKNTNNFINY